MSEQPTPLTCMRDARIAVGPSKHNAYAYGTISHSSRAAHDRAVHAEFARRIKAAGLYVEGL